MHLIARSETVRNLELPLAGTTPLLLLCRHRRRCWDGLGRPVRLTGLSPVVSAVLHRSGWLRSGSRNWSLDSLHASRSGLVGPIGGGFSPVLLDLLRDNRGLLGLSLAALHFLSVLLLALRVTVEEQVGHHVPLQLARDGSAETQDLAGQQPPHQTDRVGRFVVARDGHVNVTRRRIDVAKSNDGDVSVGALRDRLVVSSWVSDDQQTWLTEGSLDLIGVGTLTKRKKSGVLTTQKFIVFKVNLEEIVILVFGTL